MNPNLICPVCGYPDLEKPPYWPDGQTTQYEICPCCGFEFGFDDQDRGETFVSYREKWIRGGRQWWAASEPPPTGWDPVLQLQNLEWATHWEPLKKAGS